MAVSLDPEFADEMGLVAVGGDLSPRRLLTAYCAGVFPWYDDMSPICWWSPDPRAIIELEGGLHVSRRLARTLRSGKFRCTVNQAFGEVMRGCADRDEGTWITRDMFDAYVELHRLGYAHSVEVWCEGELAGGLYGVAIGAFFSGESMFHYETDASKVALAQTVARLRERGYRLFDIQLLSDHTRRMGAVEIPRKEYLRRLHAAIRGQASFVV